LVQFALSKRPSTLVLEFFAGNDATDSIEDAACDAVHHDFRCRLDTVAAARALSAARAFRGLSAFGDFSPGIEFVRGIRSESLSLALATRLTEQVRHRVASNRTVPPVLYLNGELIAKPGFTHFPTPEAMRLEWVQRGLDLTRAAYDRFAAAVRGSEAKVVLVYNPTSYEIYRDLIVPGDVDRTADQIAALQTASLAEYSRTHAWQYCDLTDSFRTAVQRGARGLFSAHDGVHWSQRG